MTQEIITPIKQQNEYSLSTYPKSIKDEIPQTFKTYGINQDQLGKRGEEIPIESVNTVAGKIYTSIDNIATTKNINLNATGLTNLLRVPNGKSLVITDVILRGSSGDLTTASFSVGFNSATYDNIVANTVHSTIATASDYKILSIKNPAVIGTPGQILKLNVQTPEGVVFTIKIDIIGYYI